MLAYLWGQMADYPEQEHLWILDSIFWRVILFAGEGPRHGDAYSLTKEVRRRLQRWRGGEYKQLWSEAVEASKQQQQSADKKRKKKKEQAEEALRQQERNAKRATTLA